MDFLLVALLALLLPRFRHFQRDSLGIDPKTTISVPLSKYVCNLDIIEKQRLERGLRHSGACRVV